MQPDNIDVIFDSGLISEAKLKYISETENISNEFDVFDKMFRILQ